MIFNKLYCRTAVPLALILSIFLNFLDGVFVVRYLFSISVCLDRLNSRCPEVGLDSLYFGVLV